VDHKSDVPHTVTSDNGGPLSSSTLQPNQTFSFTFTAPGTFAYHCSIHPYMKGTVNRVRAEFTGCGSGHGCALLERCCGFAKRGSGRSRGQRSARQPAGGSHIITSPGSGARGGAQDR